MKNTEKDLASATERYLMEFEKNNEPHIENKKNRTQNQNVNIILTIILVFLLFIFILYFAGVVITA